MRVFLDIGHGPENSGPGSNDPGAVSKDGLTEHQLVTEEVRWLVTELADGDPDIIVVPEYSRSDVIKYVNYMYRKGDVFISLHLNASVSEYATGTEVVIAHGTGEERREQARLLGQAVAKHLGVRFRRVIEDTETRHGYLAVLRRTRPPAFLLEACFISNAADVMLFRKYGSEAIYGGIMALVDTGDFGED